MNQQGAPSPQQPYYSLQSYYPPPPYPYPYPVPQMRNGYGVAALVLGLVSVLFAAIEVAVSNSGGGTAGTIVFLDGVVIIGAILAIVFGAVGRSHYNRRQATNGGMAIAGIVLGSLVLGLMLVGLIFLLTVLS